MRKEKYKINGEISLRGKFVHFFMPTANKRFFKLASGFLSLSKGRKNRKYSVEEVYVGKDLNLRVCIYSRLNSSASNRPAILWLHGGGYGMGIPEYEFSFIKDFLKA